MIKISVASSVVEPVILADVVTQGRIDSTAENAYIESLITVARANAENKTHRLLRPGTVTLTMDSFKAVELLPSPLRETSSLTIQYVDSTGGVSLLGSSVYEIHDNSDASPAVLTTAYGQSWPSIRDVKGAITITFLAGYTTSTSATAHNPVPDPIKHWIKLTAIGMFENRTALNDANSVQALGYQFLDGLLEPYVVHVVE
jgi:uncharacterized phiE125 gp8 family phage protein